MRYHLLIRHRWPGNVRELENAIERGVLVAKGPEIAVADLPDSVRGESPHPSAEFAVPPNRTLAEIERITIQQTLERTNWNKEDAWTIGPGCCWRRWPGPSWEACSGICT